MFEKEEAQARAAGWLSGIPLEQEIRKCRAHPQPEKWPAHVVLLADHPDFGDVPEPVARGVQSKLEQFSENGGSHTFMFGNQPQYVIQRVRAYLDQR